MREAVPAAPGEHYVSRLRLRAGNGASPRIKTEIMRSISASSSVCWSANVRTRSSPALYKPLRIWT